MSHGILNEIYHPRVDRACTRDLGFIVTDGKTYFSEEKRDARSETSQVALGASAYRIVNTALDGRYRIEKEVLTDPRATWCCNAFAWYRFRARSPTSAFM